MAVFRPKLLVFSLAFLLLASTAAAQAGPPNGPRQVDPRWHAFRGATLIAAPGQRIDNATIVIRDGVIVAVGAEAEPPAGARVWDLAGRYVYAGLIEPYLPVDAPPPGAEAAQAHWNSKVTPQRSALDGAGVDEKTREQLRAMGFAAAALAPKGGVFRGRGELVLLADPSEAVGTRSTGVVRRDVYDTLAFDRSGRGYPSSLMGCVALIRQTLLDAGWYANNHEVFAASPQGREAPPANAALVALGTGGPDGTPMLFETGDELEALVALRVAAEFDRPSLIVGSGTEYRRLAALAEAGARVILPLAFPQAPEVATLAEAESVTLRDLMGWEQAPTNPRRVAASGIEAALTTYRLSQRGDFTARLRTAIEYGLSEDQALAMLTTHPARMLGVADRLGEVASGRIANLVVTDGPLFDADTHVLDVWVRGQRYAVRDPELEALVGSWSLESEAVPALAGTLKVGAKNKVTLQKGDTKLRARRAEVGPHVVDFVLEGGEAELAGVFAMHAVHEGDRLVGTGRAPDGARFVWTAARLADAGSDPEGSDPKGSEPKAGDAEGDDKTDGDEKAVDLVSDVPEALPTPFGAFGLMELPEQKNTIFRNATVWGVLTTERHENFSIVVRDGRIAWMGPEDLEPTLEDYEVIDCSGKHITPGLIDCHSHTGIAKGVNEGTQAVTSEVRILDAVNPDDINWYRQLAGGVTAVQQLHGSANPIGGQSNVVKLRWGVAKPDDMYLRGAKPAIKFALGENVKRTRSNGPARYPSSRMGVEALMRDRFLAAREYSQTWQHYLRLSPEEKATTMQPRRDLELDALAEILSGIRMIHCHSYRQDEILMLCRLAEEFGFTIGALQHGLEAYKVGEVVKDHAIGVSVFSDWWAYKFEVFDAIPHNGTILRKLGIIVSFNSDSSELARRLNTEAAKAVKYGGLDEKMALSFVTLGPAHQLGVERLVGSLAVSKAGDLVIWSGDPLSTYSRCEATYIDGRPYFTLAKDRELRTWVAAERQRLLQKVLSAPTSKRSGEPNETEDEDWLDDDEFHPHGTDERGVCGCFRGDLR